MIDPKKIKQKSYPDEEKCSNCNWSLSYLYSYKDFKNYCADCLLQYVLIK